MSNSISTSRHRRRRGARQRTRPAAPYVPFGSAPALDESDGSAMLKQHLAWLLANLDYFATHGRVTLHTLSRALHADVEALGLLAPLDVKAGDAPPWLLYMLKYYEDLILEAWAACFNSTWEETSAEERERAQQRVRQLLLAGDQAVQQRRHRQQQASSAKAH